MQPVYHLHCASLRCRSWTRYKINRPSFMRRYTTFYDSMGRNPTSPKVDAETLKWLPLMFIVVSIPIAYSLNVDLSPSWPPPLCQLLRT